MRVFLATLGQRPEAITMALDKLLPRYAYDQIGILHTDPDASDIAAALQALVPVLKRDYPRQSPRTHALTYENHAPLPDIVDQRSAEAYFIAVLSVLRDYRIEGAEIHLLVSGGRKAMSIYTTLAAGLIFGIQDRVWTVLTEHDLMQKGVFHLPVGQLDRAQVVSLPLQPSRILPGALAEQDIAALLDKIRRSPRDAFLAELSPEERALVQLLPQHPYSSNTELGRLLNKAPKTIENQLGGIYRKSLRYFEMPDDSQRKRQMLLDILKGDL